MRESGEKGSAWMFVFSMGDGRMFVDGFSFFLCVVPCFPLRLFFGVSGQSIERSIYRSVHRRRSGVVPRGCGARLEKR